MIRYYLVVKVLVFQKKVHNIGDNKITIPMVKDLRSINVSSAVALVIGEACRQLNLF